MIVKRNLIPRLQQAARMFPVVTLTGPRQSGKTTLCRAEFPDHAYLNFEGLDTRDYAIRDPRGLLDQYKDGAIFDEVHRVPDLLSYLQLAVDDDPRPGRFILTGSRHLGLVDNVSQTLAGRTAVLYLLPFSYDELQRFESAPTGLWATIWSGGYPAIHDRSVPADLWLESHASTYAERDARQVRNIGDLTSFSTFLRLAAGRTATLQNSTGLGADVGVDDKTARAWLSVLEATWLQIRIPAWHRNVGKRLVKSPKLHFLDSGLACQLLGIRSAEALFSHPLRGALFESWVVSELYKRWTQRFTGVPPISHIRTSKGLEADLVLESDDVVRVIEAKSGATTAGSWFSAIDRVRAVVQEGERIARPVKAAIVYGGDRHEQRSLADLLPWRAVGDL